MKEEKSEAPQEKILSDKLAAPYFRLVGQTVQSRQLGQLGEAPVVDAEVQVLVQDAEILIAALHNPTAALQIDHWQIALSHKEHHKPSQRCIQVGCLRRITTYCTLFRRVPKDLHTCNCQCRFELYKIQQLVGKGSVQPQQNPDCGAGNTWMQLLCKYTYASFFYF